MSIETWGQMPRAGDDPETITEYVTRKIADHNENNQAHLGEGESIDEHRKEAVIDHPEGSILADKLTNTEQVVQDTFNNLSRWTTSGAVGTPSFSGVFLAVDSDMQQALIHSGSPFIGSINYHKEYVLQFTLGFAYRGQACEGIFGFGRVFSNDFLSGFGYELDNTQVRGYWYTSAGLEHTSWYSFSQGDRATLRAHYIPSDDTVLFFANGDQFSSITSPEKPTGQLFAPRLRFELNYKTPDNLDVTEVQLSSLLIAQQN